MKRKRMTGEIKARIPVEAKREVDRIAASRMLSSSDIIREAVMRHIDLVKKEAA